MDRTTLIRLIAARNLAAIDRFKRPCVKPSSANADAEGRTMKTSVLWLFGLLCWCSTVAPVHRFVRTDETYQDLARTAPAKMLVNDKEINAAPPFRVVGVLEVEGKETERISSFANRAARRLRAGQPGRQAHCAEDRHHPFRHGPRLDARRRCGYAIRSWVTSNPARLIRLRARIS